MSFRPTGLRKRLVNRQVEQFPEAAEGVGYRIEMRFRVSGADFLYFRDAGLDAVDHIRMFKHMRASFAAFVPAFVQFLQLRQNQKNEKRALVIAGETTVAK